MASCSTSEAAAEAALARLLAAIRACRVCVTEPAGRPLPHAPRPVVRASRQARIAIVGQAPGTRVHASGLPFNDPSGVRLRAWLGMSEAEFYDEARVAIIPMGFCFPGHDAKGGDLPPRRECAPRWREPLLALLPRIELVLLVGQYAHAWHLGRGGGLTETVRSWRTLSGKAERPRLIPLPHPSWRNNAWLKANPWFEAELAPHARREVRRLLERC